MWSKPAPPSPVKRKKNEQKEVLCTSMGGKRNENSKKACVLYCFATDPWHREKEPSGARRCGPGSRTGQSASWCGAAGILQSATPGVWFRMRLRMSGCCEFNRATHMGVYKRNGKKTQRVLGAREGDGCTCRFTRVKKMHSSRFSLTKTWHR